MSAIRSAQDVRRVITGLDPQGRSCVLFDGPAPAAEGPGIGAINLWRAGSIPVDNSAAGDAGAEPFRFEQLSQPGYALMAVEYPPGMGADDPHMHATDTVDHLVVLSGAVTLVLETEELCLRAGDVAVLRGIVHGWRNPGDVPCVAVSVYLPALPLDPGQAR